MNLKILESIPQTLILIYNSSQVEKQNSLQHEGKYAKSHIQEWSGMEKKALFDMSGKSILSS